SSSLESELWEELTLIPSVSTAKVLSVAAQSDTPIVTLDSANYRAELPGLLLPEETKETIRRRIEAGKTVVTPDRPVEYHDWRGVAWIEEAEDGLGSYMISGISGGATAVDSPAEWDPQQAIPNEIAAILGQAEEFLTQAVGDPVSVANGNLFHQSMDARIPNRGSALALARSYSSQSRANGAFGYGWTFNYAAAIFEDGDDRIFRSETGGLFRFRLSEDAYTAPPGFFATLEATEEGYALEKKRGGRLTFDSFGRLLSVADRNSNVVLIQRDEPGRITEVQGAGDRRLLFEYGEDDRIHAVTDHAGRRWDYAYDEAGDLVSCTDAAGEVTQYAYHAEDFHQHNLQSVVYPGGEVVTFDYYGNDRVARVVEAGGAETRLYYLPMRNETVVVDERNQATTYRYDNRGHITRVIHPDGNQIEAVWGDNGLPVSRTGEAGYTTSFEYDDAGNLTNIRDALNLEATFSYEND
ncbi:MAG: RHS repeat protein, partial [bacterium]|nr:RHS repeat protein [bacterium]